MDVLPTHHASRNRVMKIANGRGLLEHVRYDASRCEKRWRELILVRIVSPDRSDEHAITHMTRLEERDERWCTRDDDVRRSHCVIKCGDVVDINSQHTL